MRKISLLLTVLLFAVPAFASVTITCNEPPDDGNSVIVSYTATGEPNLVRAFALDITVNQGAKIIAVSGFKVGPSVAPSDRGYGIFPGSFDKYEIDPDDPNWADPNYSPLADPCDYPSDTKGGVDRYGKLLDTNGITVEMGALYYPTKDNSPNAPPTTGALLMVTVGGVTPGCKMTITQNVARGGVVLTNSGAPSSFVSAGYTFNNCLTYATDAEYIAWIAWTRPKCWCYARQCRGDADGKKTGPYWVANPDLTVFKAAFSKSDATLATITSGICADLDHKKTGPYRVANPDLTIFKAYFSKAATSVPDCNTDPVITGPYNFWTVP